MHIPLPTLYNKVCTGFRDALPHVPPSPPDPTGFKDLASLLSLLPKPAKPGSVGSMSVADAIEAGFLPAVDEAHGDMFTPSDLRLYRHAQDHRLSRDIPG